MKVNLMDNGPNRYELFQGFSDPTEDREVLRDVRGVRRTQNLFCDVNVKEADYPSLYTMRESDTKGLISAYQVYMHAIDEYDAALKLVGSWDHWLKLCNLKWFMEGGQGFTGVKQWRIDMWHRDNRLAKDALLQRVKFHSDPAAARTLANWDKNHKPPTEVTPEPTKSKKDTKADKENQERQDKKERVNNVTALLQERINKTS